MHTLLVAVQWIAANCVMVLPRHGLVAYNPANLFYGRGAHAANDYAAQNGSDCWLTALLRASLLQQYAMESAQSGKRRKTRCEWRHFDDARRNAAHSGGQRIDRAGDLFGHDRISRLAAIHDHENQLAAGAVGHAIQR